MISHRIEISLQTTVNRGHDVAFVPQLPWCIQSLVSDICGIARGLPLVHRGTYVFHLLEPRSEVGWLAWLDQDDDDRGLCNNIERKRVRQTQ